MVRKPPNYWTKVKCQKIALKYNHRYEFQLGSNNAYSAARRNGWVDDVCSHMKKTGNWFRRCIYAYEFPDNCVYVGLTYNLEERNRNRKKNKNDAVLRHISETNLQPIIKQLTDYVDVNIAAILESFHIDTYRKNGWDVLNVARGGTVGGKPYKWDFENCKGRVLEFYTRNEFKMNNRSAYEAARINGWLDEICSHMECVLKSWTFETCEMEAMKYRNRTELHDKANGAYNVARKNR